MGDVDAATRRIRADDIAAFDALHREVKQARRVRVLWGAAALITSVGVAISLAGNAYSTLISTFLGN